MPGSDLPFRFDMSDLLLRAKRQWKGRIGPVELTLPFLSIGISPDHKEKLVARELVIRLADRRVLSSKECCDGCIDRSLASLEKIRQLIVDKQVELSPLHDGGLYLLLDAMAAGIRQFMTYEERLPQRRTSDEGRDWDTRDAYFAALEMLRGHLARCIDQIAKIADLPPPQRDGLMCHAPAWPVESYDAPPGLDASTAGDRAPGN
jgi:hypothetical protein